MSAPVIDHSALIVGESLGDGGEGVVHLVDNHPGSAYKEFKPTVLHELREDGLERTIALLATMSSADRDFLAPRSAWPTAIVRKGGQLSGFLMPVVGPDFFCVHGQIGDPMPGMNDWNKLTFRRDWIGNPNIESNVPPLWFPDGRDLSQLSDGEKDGKLALILLLLDLANLFEVFHRNNVCIGDVSGRNILWSRSRKGNVLIIDCDGVRLNGTQAVTRSKQSPDWIDPQVTDVTNLESDRYKLSLAIYRGFFSDGLGTPLKPRIAPHTRAEASVFDAAARGTGSGPRTTALEWIQILSRFAREIQNDGRPEIDWRGQLHAVDSGNPVNPPPVSGAVTRPTISW